MILIKPEMLYLHIKIHEFINDFEENMNYIQETMKFIFIRHGKDDGKYRG